MSCRKDNVIKEFIDKKVINTIREILDVKEFMLLNEKYSDLAKSKYNLDREDLLFDINVLDRTKLRSRTVLRAIPNENFFDEIERLENPTISDYNEKEVSKPSLLSLPKPIVNFVYLSNAELVDTKDPIQSKMLQDQIKKEAEELQNLINCIWS